MLLSHRLIDLLLDRLLMCYSLILARCLLTEGAEVVCNMIIRDWAIHLYQRTIIHLFRYDNSL